MNAFYQIESNFCKKLRGESINQEKWHIAICIRWIFFAFDKLPCLAKECWLFLEIQSKRWLVLTSSVDMEISRQSKCACSALRTQSNFNKMRYQSGIYLPKFWVDLSFSLRIILDLFFVLKLSIFGSKSRTITSLNK